MAILNGDSITFNTKPMDKTVDIHDRSNKKNSGEHIIFLNSIYLFVNI
ncbi:hypothetical protein [Clostridium beijerinckii]|nr:hypothetical protein [Clostridium beijerinckii]MBA8933229.1 hypothetical protein [Clostridium beijerinckii]NRT36825.1 hypothetical protein [Clostridium beijerinckii]NRT43742.1 hypothetical protein [Clostridium beijerinckii]NRU37430.1 hypothetical protein [Clostridium beijerinckii]NRZ22265.1 hypothetical protein [Clostridium beijerinckii]